MDRGVERVVADVPAVQIGVVVGIRRIELTSRVPIDARRKGRGAGLRWEERRIGALVVAAARPRMIGLHGRRGAGGRGARGDPHRAAQPRELQSARAAGDRHVGSLVGSCGLTSTGEAHEQRVLGSGPKPGADIRVVARVGVAGGERRVGRERDGVAGEVDVRLVADAAALGAPGICDAHHASGVRIEVTHVRVLRRGHTGRVGRLDRRLRGEHDMTPVAGEHGRIRDPRLRHRLRRSNGSRSLAPRSSGS